MNKDSLRQLVESADRAYAARADAQSVRESVDCLRNTSKEMNEYEVLWRLSRALFLLGQESAAAGPGALGASTQFRQSRNFHAEGADAGRRSTRLMPERVEGHFWLGVNVALLAGLEQGPKAAIHALQAMRALRGAIRIDAAYHSAGPLRVLARLHHKLPRFMGGGVTRARANFERAIRIDPANTVTRIYFAELLLEAGETARARSQLEHILNAPLDPAWAFEIARDQVLANEMLAGLPSLNRRVTP